MNTLFVLVELVLCRTPLLWVYAPFLPVFGLLYMVCRLFSVRCSFFLEVAASQCGCASLTSSGRAWHILYTPPRVSSVSSTCSKEPSANCKHTLAYPFLNPEVVGNKVPLYAFGVAVASVLSFTIMWGVSRLRDWFRPTAKGIPPSMSEKVVEDGERLCITISKESITRV